MSNVGQAAAKKTDPLDAWLERVEARLLWQSNVKGIGTVTCYLVNQRLAMVLRYQERRGWELFVPASNENNTALTLDGAAEALGVDGCAGLLDE